MLVADSVMAVFDMKDGRTDFDLSWLEDFADGFVYASSLGGGFRRVFLVRMVVRISMMRMVLTVGCRYQRMAAICWNGDMINIGLNRLWNTGDR